MPLTHKEAREALETDWLSDRDNRDDALDDLRFLALDQWTETERNEREQDGRPCLTLDRLNQFVNQVSGDIRQAQPALEVFPVDSQDDVGVAQVYEGLIRQIEYRSKGTSAYSHGAHGAVSCGIGHWRLETERPTDSTFDQEIRIKRVMDPLSVVWDADSGEITRADANRCTVHDWIHEKTFKDRYKREGVSIDGEHNRWTSGLYWRRDDFVRIAEFWYATDEKRTLVLTRDGRTIDITDLDELGIAQIRFFGVLAEREVDAKKIHRQLMDGQDWLDDEADWAGRHIPIIPCVGSEIAFDGRIVRSGLIRGAKDGQKLYNIWRSAGAEVVAKSPKAPWLVTAGNIEGYENYWNNANRSNLPYLPFKPDPESPGFEPKRQDPPTAPAAIWQESQITIDDMHGSTGIYPPSLGAQGNESSGRAILARQREGDTGSFLYTDNFAAAMQRTGEILIDLIPKIYDTQRQIMILDRDGVEQFVPINTTTIAPDGTPLLINDLSDGRFNVRVKVGASYTTARVEARELMSQVLANNPDAMQIIGDLFFESMDFPGADKLAERWRRVIPPQVLEDQQPDPMAEVMQRLQIEGAQAEVDKTQSETDKNLAQATKARAETVTELETI